MLSTSFGEHSEDFILVKFLMFSTMYFSVKISNLIFVYNIHRFGHQFELPLLAQSVIMNVTMLAMIRLCVKFNGKSQILKSKDRLFTGIHVHYFDIWISCGCGLVHGNARGNIYSTPLNYIFSRFVE